MADHGKLFDNFSERASHAHGGSYFDTGFGLQAIQDAHGRLYDLFGAPKDSDAHGERFDEFGWRDMPLLHGSRFDDDFQMPDAGSGEHGSTWFDVFRGGRTQARVIVNGKDVEGTVIDVNREFATLRGHDGQTHEVGLGQFLAFRTPNEHQAAPSIPASDAHAPSAHSADAHGGHTGPGTQPFSPDSLPSVVQDAPQGQYTEPRTGVPDGLMNTFTHLKSLDDSLDVLKDLSSVHTGSWHGNAAFCTSPACQKAASKHQGIGDLGASKLEVRTGNHGMHAATCANCGNKVMFTHERGHAVGKTADDADVGKEHIGWGPMVRHLEGQGHSPESADKIAGYINARKHHLGKFAHKTALDGALDVLKGAGINAGATNGKVPMPASQARTAVTESAGHAPLSGDPANEFHDFMDPGHGSAIHATHKATGMPVWLEGSGLGHELCPSARIATGTIGKSVDATETAIQGAPTAKTVSHRSNCPRGGSAPCGADVSGKCSLCGYKVRDHEAVGKAFGAPADTLAGGQTVTVNTNRSPGGSGQATSDPPDVAIPHREHKASDHHMQLGKRPGKCPHCGEVIEDLDRISDQGAPSRAHKCIGTGIDLLKALA